MTVYKIYVKNRPGAEKNFDHIEDTTSRIKRNEIIREYTANGKDITVIEYYPNGTTCRCEYSAR